MIDGKIKWDQNSKTPGLNLCQEIGTRYMSPRLRVSVSIKGLQID